MADVLSPGLALVLQEAGNNDSTWGDIANENFSKIDRAITGTGPISLTGGIINPTADQLRPGILVLTGATDTDVRLPNKPRVWMVVNAGSAMAFFATAASPTIRTRIAPGQSELLISDGNATSRVTSGPEIGSLAFLAYTPPAGSPWLVLNGQNVNRSAYFELFARIGTAFGNGDGATTFGIGNLVDRYVRGGSAIGTTLDDQIKGHTHAVSMDDAGAHTPAGTISLPGPATYDKANIVGILTGTTSAANVHSGTSPTAVNPPVPNTATFNGTPVAAHKHANAVAAAGAETETRPKSLVYLPCIRAF